MIVFKMKTGPARWVQETAKAMNFENMVNENYSLICLSEPKTYSFTRQTFGDFNALPAYFWHYTDDEMIQNCPLKEFVTQVFDQHFFSSSVKPISSPIRDDKAIYPSIGTSLRSLLLSFHCFRLYLVYNSYCTKLIRSWPPCINRFLTF